MLTLTLDHEEALLLAHGPLYAPGRLLEIEAERRNLEQKIGVGTTTLDMWKNRALAAERELIGLRGTRASVPQGANYCLGFVFDELGDAVLMVRKRRPLWQAGKLNGVGGKIERGETPRQAMSRECAEETGLQIDEDQWEHFATLDGGAVFRVEVFSVFIKDIGFARRLTDEIVYVFSVHAEQTSRRSDVIGNVQLLLSIATTKSDIHKPVVILYDIPR